LTLIKENSKVGSWVINYLFDWLAGWLSGWLWFPVELGGWLWVPVENGFFTVRQKISYIIGSSVGFIFYVRLAGSLFSL